MSTRERISQMRSKVSPFFSYFGGKHRQIASYPNPQHKRIVEPFAGSAGYATKYHMYDIELYDISPYVCGVWDYLIRSSAADILALPDIVYDTRDLPDSYCQEIKWLMGFWNANVSVVPHSAMSSRSLNTLNDIANGKIWAGAGWNTVRRDIIARQVDLIKHWRISQKCYTEIDIADTATWFVDPPYQDSGKRYLGHNTLDFEHLGNWCKTLNGQAIVCETINADWLPFQFHNINRCSNGNYSVEVIWTNEKDF